MAIVHQLDKRSGITYVYESTSYWDKEKKQSRSHRRLIGRLDPETGEVLPTDGRRKKTDAPAEQGASAEGASAAEKDVPVRKKRPGKKKEEMSDSRRYPLSAELLDHLCQIICLDGVLESCCPAENPEELTAIRKTERMIRYLTIETGGVKERFCDWEKAHFEDAVGNDQQNVSWDIVRNYFESNLRRQQESAYWFYNFCYMTSSREAVEYMQNGIPEKRSAIVRKNEKTSVRKGFCNAALLIGEDTGTAAGFAVLPDNIPYFDAADRLEKSTGTSQLPQRMCMDAALFRRDNIDRLLRDGVEFLVEIPRDSELFSEFSDRAVHADETKQETDISSRDLNHVCLPISWKPVRKNAYRRDPYLSERKLFLHMAEEGGSVRRMLLSNIVEDPVLAEQIFSFGLSVRRELVNVRERISDDSCSQTEECLAFPAVIAGGLRNLLGIRISGMKERQTDLNDYSETTEKEIQSFLDFCDRDYDPSDLESVYQITDGM